MDGVRKSILTCVTFFLLYLILLIYIIISFELVFVCNDWYVLELLFCVSIVLYAFFSLLELLIMRKRNSEKTWKYHSLLLFELCQIPASVFLFSSHYIEMKMRVIYLIVNCLVIAFLFWTKRKGENLYSVPILTLVILFFVSNSHNKNTEMKVTIQRPIENVAVEFQSGIVQKTDDVSSQGTFGTYCAQTVFTDAGIFKAHEYIRFTASNSILYDAFVKKNCSDSMRIVKEGAQTDISWNGTDTYVIELESEKTVYLLKTDLKPDEISFLPTE